MAGEAEPGKAKAAGIVGILIGCIALINLICGFIYIGLVDGAVDGAGLYSGFGVSTCISTLFTHTTATIDYKKPRGIRSRLSRRYSHL